MKYFLVVIVAFSSLLSRSQVTGEEIKKQRVYKIVEKYFVEDSLKTTNAYFYDKHGNIFKETWGQATENTINEYENGRLKKIIDYDHHGKEEHTTEFLYDSDGSYMTVTTEKHFGAKNYFWYKSNGDIIKAFGGDTIFYHYNKLGKLEEIKTGGNSQIKFYTKFIYSPKGELVKVEAPTDEFNSTTESYEYDLNGKRIKTTTKTIRAGISRLSVATYEYNEKGLLIKEIVVDTEEDSRSRTTKNIYEYEFYDDQN